MARILVVDDIAENRDLLSTLMRYAGHEVVEAGDGRAALAAVAREQPDLVLCDVLMPTMDGYEFVRRLRERDELGPVEVIFCTATFVEQEARALAVSCGVRYVLTKPCEPEDVLRTVAAALADPPAALPRNTTRSEFMSDHRQILANKVLEKVRELEEANQRLNEHHVRMRLEHDTALALAEARQPDEGMCAVVRIVCEALGWESGRCWLLDEAADLLRLSAQWIPPGRVYAQALALQSTGLTQPRGHGLPGAVLASGEPLWVGDLAADARLTQRDVIALTGGQGACLYPIAFGGRVIGVLSFLQMEARQPDDAVTGSLRVIASQLAQFLLRKRAEAALAASEAFTRSTLDSLLEHVCVIDSDGRILSTNLAWRRFAADNGAGPSQTREGDNYLAVCDGVEGADQPQARAMAQGIRRVLAGEESAFVLEYTCHSPHEPRWFVARASRFAGAGPVRVVVVHENITQRKRAELRAGQLQRILAVLGDINSLIIRVKQRQELFDDACRVLVENGGFRKAWIGVTAVTPPGLDIVSAWGGQPADSTYFESLAQALRERFRSGDIRFDRLVERREPMFENDVERAAWMDLREEAVAGGTRALALLPLVAGGATVGVLAIHADEPGIFDDEERKLLQQLAGDLAFAMEHLSQAEQINRLAYFDALTGQANGMLFSERLAQLIAAVAARRLPGIAVVLIDLERFKSINDVYGRHVGDEVLRQVAGRLAAHGGGAARIARLGPDHFGLMLPDLTAEFEVARELALLQRRCFQPVFEAAGVSLRVSARMGVAICPHDGDDAERIHQRAEAALKRAKRASERLVFYDARMTDAIAEKLALEHRLRDALHQGQFVLHYQPKVDSVSRRLTGVEALIRWQTEDMGLVPPGRFIPLMEETGLIGEVGAWALRQAAADYQGWREQGLAAPRIAVNVSAIQLRQRDFVAVVDEALSQGGEDAGVDLEITESAIMDDVEETIVKLVQLRGRGIRIAVDDFGTGYSSLAYLARLPVQVLKIDQTFVARMLKDADSHTMVSTMISLAHALRMRVVAEGVETAAQAQALATLDCDELQGFLISRPVPEAALRAWLAPP